jgi:hypothetical protein
MKKVKVFVLAVVLVLGFTSWTWASYSVEGPSEFYVVDGDSDNTVTLWVTAIPLLQPGTLYYDVGAGFTPVSNAAININTPDDKKLISFQYVTTGTPAVPSITYDTASMLFIGSGTNVDDLYYSVQMMFGNLGQLTLALPIGSISDRVAPVPVPAAAWLLGSGLIGLIGIRRKKLTDDFA